MSEQNIDHPFLPLAAAARFKRNFLQQVVCELRFPTLFELNAAQPNPHFARAVRKAYPHHSHHVAEVSVEGASIERTHTHIFKSKNLDWTITLRQSAITVETSKYVSFDELRSRVNSVLEIASDVIDSDFFTRVGIRYINAVPMNIEGGNTVQFRGWIREGLASILVEEDLGALFEYSGRLAGSATFGTFLLQHGVGYNQSTKKPEYILDFDFSKENIELTDVAAVMNVLHRNQFSMFMWALGPKALEYIGPSIIREDENV